MAEANHLTSALMTMHLRATELSVRASEGDDTAMVEIVQLQDKLSELFTEKFADDDGSRMAAYVMYIIGLLALTHKRDLHNAQIIEASVRSLAALLPQTHELSAVADPDKLNDIADKLRFQRGQQDAHEHDHYVTGTGQRIGNIHALDDCEGPFCVIHRPCPGPWDLWPTHWRGDTEIMGIQVDLWRGFERLCPCGVGHPAVEEYLRGSAPDSHGCCGECPCSPSHCDEAFDADGVFIGFRGKA